VGEAEGGGVMDVDCDDPSLEDISHDTWGSEELLLAALMSMLPDRRIYLARDLLRGTGLCVANVVGAQAKGESPLVALMSDDYAQGFADGWNVCRDAHMADR